MTASVRVLPLLVVAGLSLFVLKSMGLLLSGGYVVSGVAPAKAQDPKAGAVAPPQQSAQDAPGAVETDTAVNMASETADPKDENPADAGKGETAAADAPVKNKAKKAGPDKDTQTQPTSKAPKAELAILEGLGNRRKELDKRQKNIDLRENLLKAAEMRVQARIAELKSIQAQIEGELKKQDNYRKEQYENLVKMYSSMKPKDAARIFNRMDLEILTGIATQIKPRVMSSIMASMDPSAAQRLTLEIANRGKPEPKKAASLPKIESQKTN